MVQGFFSIIATTNGLNEKSNISDQNALISNTNLAFELSLLSF